MTERNLWDAVICRAIKDYKKGVDRLKVVKWIGTKDFYTVCEFAGYDPEWVILKIGQALK